VANTARVLLTGAGRKGQQCGGARPALVPGGIAAPGGRELYREAIADRRK